MKQYLLLYSGPPIPPNESHEGWREWFTRIGEALVDRGSRMTAGVALRGDSTSDDATPLRGYSVIQAEDREEAVELVRDHPLLAVAGYTVEIFELPGK